MTLIELLIAMTLLAIGIAAIVAGYTSGVFAVTRADKASVAATLADQQMESYHQEAYSAIPAPPSTSTSTPTGSDGRTYWMQSVVSWACPDPSEWTLSGTTCTPISGSGPGGTTPPATEAVKQVTIQVRESTNTDGTPCSSSCNGHLLVTESSTFDSLSG